MRFHVLALAHAVTSLKYILCAFTQKIYKWCPMMLENHNNEVIHYGHEKSDVICSEHVTVTNDDDLKAAIQWHIENQGLSPGYNPLRDGFVHDSRDPAYRAFENNAVREIRKRYQPGDFLLCFWGMGHKPIADALSDLPELHVVEPGIGYPTTFSEYRVFESQAKMNIVRGQQHERWWNSRSGSIPYTTPLWHDTVIPNYWVTESFPKEAPEKKDYLFFIGRISKNKGLEIAVKTAKETGRKLFIAGQGDVEGALGYTPDCDYEFLGIVNEQERNKWMSEAWMGLTPSLYIEPFCGTHVEFWFNYCGISTTPWGVFSETVVNDLNGYKCVQFDGGNVDEPSFVWAVNNADRIDPLDCRKYAESKFSTDAVRTQYENYFKRILRHNEAVKKGLDPFFFKKEHSDLWEEDD